MVALSLTLSDSNPQFQGHPTVWRWISCKRCVLQPQLLWNSN